MKGFKGFDKNLKCRNFQFEVGKEYEQEGEIKLCHNGFHFCEDPMDVFAHYPAYCNNRFCLVEGSEDLDYDTNKVACRKIKIKKEVGLLGLLEAKIECILNNNNKSGYSPVFNTTSIEDYVMSISNESYHVAISYGKIGTISKTTDWGGLSYCCGAHSAAISQGILGVSVVSGYYSIAQCTNIRSVSVNTGRKNAAINSGRMSVAVSLSSLGIALCTGVSSIAIQSSQFGMAENSGKYGVALNYSKNGVSKVTGKSGIALSLNFGGKAMGEIGCWLCLAEWDKNDTHLLGIKSFYVDGEKVKANTYYSMVHGELVEDTL